MVLREIRYPPVTLLLINVSHSHLLLGYICPKIFLFSSLWSDEALRFVRVLRGHCVCNKVAEEVVAGIKVSTNTVIGLVCDERKLLRSFPKSWWVGTPYSIRTFAIAWW